MGGKRNDRRRVRGIPGRAPAERERRLIRHKEREIRAVILRLRALERDDHVAAVEERDECFREVRRLAVTPKGLVSEEFRRELWPFLLGTDGAACVEQNGHTNIGDKATEAHRDAAQVEKDVERSLWHYDVLQGIRESERRVKRRALTQIILGVLDANHELFYFQGYHDIVSVFLLTLGNSKNTLQAVRNVSETYHREPMRSGFEQVMATTRLLFPLLDAADEVLFQHLHESGVEPFFALPWMITWFAHQLKRFGDVVRLYDVFLVTHPLFSLYVSASVCGPTSISLNPVLLEAREKVLRCERDFGTMHGMLSNLPLSMDVEKVIARALVLFHQLPPEKLRQQSGMDASSVIQNMYFQRPFEYQSWPSLVDPMLKNVPPLPPRRSRDGPNGNYMLGSWPKNDKMRIRDNGQSEKYVRSYRFGSFLYSSTLMMATLSALAVMLMALLLHAYNDFMPIDSYLPSFNVNASVEAHFSDSYYQARALFRSRAEAAGASLFSLPLEHLKDLDLTIDIAVLQGSTDRVLLHISGTHGVEGFAGSAIQVDLLDRAGANPRSSKRKPTVIFVHALNAYGFSQLRRFNEHGVDLNRNWLTREEFQERQARNPNRLGYLDVYELLNPTDLSGIKNWFWVKGIAHLATKGFDAIKQATIGGNYRFPNTLFFGGTELEPSLALLQQFLQEHVDFNAVTKFAMIDIHTGLGPAGVDTLMLGVGSDMSVARSVFTGPVYEDKVVFVHDNENPVSRGYDGVGGFTFDGVAKLLGPQANGNALMVCQEFGTVPGVFILKAMVEENTMYHHNPSPTGRLPYAQKLRDVFYLHQSSSWKSEVLRRGADVYDRLHGYLSS
ncbi:Hypothetical protein PHPALM_6833 [Phytophthora palmivora]|uniref:Rab-GAP TBC domain-containing protein n=1 Tax=Phytophthora palmivora TaxID=4796 RepID=A0A2P4YDW3_9STRA|nr:Hypothetical protein PHPALM_6833 [Phytophthora palmivora]